MKFIFKALFIIAFSLQVFAQQSLPKELTIGFIPSGEKETLKKGAFIIAKALQEELGIPVNIYLAKTYSSLVLALKEKKVDFAFLTAGTLVAAEKNTKIQILLKKVWSEPFYYSVILATKKSNIKKIEDLKGKKITFVDQKSTSGFLYPQVMFKKLGWTDKVFKEVQFSGSHANSVYMLEKNETDAIAVFSDDKEGRKTAWEKFAKDKKSFGTTRLIWHSEPIPNDPFCVRQEFYDQFPKLVHTLMFSLIDIIEKNKSIKEVTDTVGTHGFLPATSRQYDPVREMIKELGQQVE